MELWSKQWSTLQSLEHNVNLVIIYTYVAHQLAGQLQRIPMTDIKKLQKSIPTLTQWNDGVTVTRPDGKTKCHFKFDDLESVSKVLEMQQIATQPWKVGNVIIEQKEEKRFTFTRDHLVIDVITQPKYTATWQFDPKAMELFAFALDRAQISLYPKKLEMTFQEAVSYVLDGHQKSLEKEIAFHEKFAEDVKRICASVDQTDK